MTLPSIFFAVAVTATLGNGLVQAMVPIGVLLAPAYFRVTRAVHAGGLFHKYVEAAELLGASKGFVVRTHVLRKVLPNIVVTTASSTAGALLAVSFLTFLGVGVRPPAPTSGRSAVVRPEAPCPRRRCAVHPRGASSPSPSAP